MRSFSEKDFLAIHVMSHDAKFRIHTGAKRAVQRLRLRPTRKGHAVKFSKAELLIEHTTNVRDIEAFMESVVAPLPIDTGNRKRNRRINADLKTQFDEACEKLCKIFVLTNVK